METGRRLDFDQISVFFLLRSLTTTCYFLVVFPLMHITLWLTYRHIFHKPVTFYLYYYHIIRQVCVYVKKIVSLYLAARNSNDLLL